MSGKTAFWRGATGWFSPFSAPAEGIVRTVDVAGRRSPEFATTRVDAESDERITPSTVFDAVRDHIRAERRLGRRTAIAAFTVGSRDRLARVLEDHGLSNLQPVDNWPECAELPVTATGMLVLGLDHGFSTDDMTLIAEQDILGDRLDRPSQRRRRAEAFIADAGELSVGDHVVHIEHGIGKYEGLETIVAANTPHDCLRVAYNGGDRLFVPVENVEVLSPLRVVRSGGVARPAGRGGVAVTQGQAETASARNGRRADQDRRPADPETGQEADPRSHPVR